MEPKKDIKDSNYDTQDENDNSENSNDFTNSGNENDQVATAGSKRKHSATKTSSQKKINKDNNIENEKKLDEWKGIASSCTNDFWFKTLDFHLQENQEFM